MLKAPKSKNVYVCESCGGEFLTWMGQCPKCGEWNTLTEVARFDFEPKKGSSLKNGGRKGLSLKGIENFATPLSLVKEKSQGRIKSGIEEFDRVLGGGFVEGQVVLLAGEPGVGKSTLVLEICKSLKDPILYVSGEETFWQVKSRAQRMNLEGENLSLTSETNINVIESFLISNEGKYKYLIVDSIQTLYSQDLMSSVGSLSQIRECSQRLVRLAKSLNICVLLIGHITKEGDIAGPKVLEHVVDTVLYMEGDTQNLYRVLRTSKNRFGPIWEVGIFEITDKGIKQVSNPQGLFIGGEAGLVAGSCIAVAMEGFRPILYEIQALAVKSNFGYPKRTANGFNVNRLQVLLAVLEKRCFIPCYDYDIYLNIAGGFKVLDPACDLAVCLSLASAVLDKPLNKRVALWGEVGLLGEIRPVPYVQKREGEAKKLGYNIVKPKKYLKELIDDLIKIDRKV